MLELIARYPLPIAGVLLSALFLFFMIWQLRSGLAEMAAQKKHEASQKAYRDKMSALTGRLATLKTQFDRHPNTDNAFRTALWGAVDTHTANSLGATLRGDGAGALQHLEVAVQEAEDAVNALSGNYIAVPNESSD